MSTFQDAVTPLPGSVINVSHGRAGSVELKWKSSGESFLSRAFIILFMGGWLGGWTVGGLMAMMAVLQPDMPIGARLFMLFWLCGWLAGEIFAAVFLFQMLRPRRPDRIELTATNLVFEPSACDVKIKGLRKKRGLPVFEFRKVAAPEFILDRADKQHRLYFDLGADRVEIGAGLKEPEREWLHNVLQTWRGSTL